MSVLFRWSKPRCKMEAAHKEGEDWDWRRDSPWWILILRSSGSAAPPPRTLRGQQRTRHQSHHSTNCCREWVCSSWILSWGILSRETPPRIWSGPGLELRGLWKMWDLAWKQKHLLLNSWFIFLFSFLGLGRRNLWMRSWSLLLSSSRMLLSWHSGSHMSGRQNSVSGRCQGDVSKMITDGLCDAEPMCGLYWHWQSPAIFLRSIESKTPGPAYQGKRINILTHGGAGAGEVKCERKEGMGKVCVWRGDLQLFVRNALWRPFDVKRALIFTVTIFQ